jgi:hypothetical protein
MWDSPNFDLQRYFANVWEADVALYQGQGEEAWAINETAWPKLRGSDLLHMPMLRISATFLRGKCAVAGGKLRPAREAQATLTREGTKVAAALAALLGACITAASPQRENLAAELANAESLLTQVEMIPWAAAVQYRRAALDPAVASPDWMRDQHIVNPERLVNFLMPGEWPVADRLR